MGPEKSKEGRRVNTKEGTPGTYISRDSEYKRRTREESFRQHNDNPTDKIQRGSVEGRQRREKERCRQIKKYPTKPDSRTGLGGPLISLT